MADLTDLEIDARIAAAGPKETFPAGRKLYVQVVNGRATMLMRFKSPATGKSRMMGLGGYTHRTLEQARDAIMAADKLLARGIDPIDERNVERAAVAASQVKFRQVALDGYWRPGSTKFTKGYTETHAREWGARHLAHWKMSLNDWIFPHIGDLTIGRLTRAHVVEILNQPVDDGTLWDKRNPTAHLVRQRIELVWNAAKSDDLVSGDNPAEWLAMKNLFADSPSVHTKVHRRMLPWKEVPAFFAKLRTRNMTRSRALELCILTGARTKNIISARWAEFDLGAATWTVDKQHMKNDTLDWLCPLSLAALDLLRSMPRSGELVFPGTKPDKPMAHDRLAKELKDAGCTDNVHGMRASFRSWGAANSQNHAACEYQLHHVEGSDTVKAYQQDNLLEQRRAIVELWGRHVTSALPATNVIPMRAAGAA